MKTKLKIAYSQVFSKMRYSIGSEISQKNQVNHQVWTQAQRNIESPVYLQVPSIDSLVDLIYPYPPQ